MKRLFLLFLLFTSIIMKANCQCAVFITDNSGKYTNIRAAAKGKIVDKIPTELIVMLVVNNPVNGWWRIVGDSYSAMDSDDVTLKGSTTGYWIHSSVIGLGTRNYGGETISLRKSPSASSKAVFSFSDERRLHPVDICEGWVRVRTEDGRHEGWIEEEWLCGNPVTNCC